MTRFSSVPKSCPPAVFALASAIFPSSQVVGRGQKSDAQHSNIFFPPPAKARTWAIAAQQKSNAFAKLTLAAVDDARVRDLQ